ncbi:MAG: glycosyltransferase family 2 protein [Pyrinomonadaceae bacterium]
MPKVSVIIPTYNRVALLAQTVESAQMAGSDVEVIVVDDGSTDQTSEMCAALPGIRYIRLNRNQGNAYARNAGILLSEAEFIAFLDDDDLRLPGTIDLQVRALENAPEAAFVYGRVLIGDADHRLPTGEIAPDNCPQGDVFWELLAGNFIQMPSVIARRQSLVETGLFHSNIMGVEDWEMWLRLAEQFPVIAVDEAVAIYRKGSSLSGQLTSNRVKMFHRMLYVQEEALRGARARAAPRAKRRKTRRGLRHLAYDVMILRKLMFKDSIALVV